MEHLPSPPFVPQAGWLRYGVRVHMKQCSTCKRVYPDLTLTCSDDGSALQIVAELLPGTIIRGKYRIQERLGAGGMATVYRAVHIAFDEERAIKIVNDRFSGDASLSQRFRTEAIVTRKLRHPNAVFIEDLDVMDDGRPFMVMELVKGPTLRDIVGKEAPLSPLRAIDIARQIALALGAAHAAGITHRDIKPENVVLIRGADGEIVKVLDFGIAKVRTELFQGMDSNETSPGMIIGTPAYMAPEQADPKLGVQIDGRADLYSLGIVWYEMLTGYLPFAADSPMGMLFHQLNSAPRELSDTVPRLGRYRELCMAVMKCLNKDKKHRYANAEELVQALARAEHEIKTAPSEASLPDMKTITGSSFKTLAVSPSAVEVDRAERNTPDPKLEIAHVLFLDIVGYSRLPMNLQAAGVQDLQRIVSSTPEYMAAAKGDLITSPTGDGMALSFFGNPEAPIRCALYIASSLRHNPHLKVRMGLHSGPVYRMRDIKDSINVAGGGINYAQRVMDCGDAGHILASGTIADLLTQHSSWSSCMHELGVAEVKHGVKLRIFNVHTTDAGNPAVPEKLRTSVRAGGSHYSAQELPSVGVLTPPPVSDSRTSGFASANPLTPTLVEQAAKDLAGYIGPIAKLIVKRASQSCSNAKELYLTVAQEIDSPKDRERFLNSRPRG